MDKRSRTEQLMRTITERIWNAGDQDCIDDLVAEGFVDHVDVPGMESLSGRDKYRASVSLVRAAFPDYHEAIDLLLVDGDYAVSYVTITGTHTGELMGLPPTGKSVEYHSVGILRFTDGQVAERWGVGDTMTMLGQLGLLG